MNMFGCACRASSNKENSTVRAIVVGKLDAIAEGEAASTSAACPLQLEQPQEQQPQQQQQAGSGSRRRKRLLPSVPLSSEMRSALGELEDVALRHQHMAQKQLAAVAAASAAEAPGKRSRRQTKFFRL